MEIGNPLNPTDLAHVLAPTFLVGLGGSADVSGPWGSDAEAVRVFEDVLILQMAELSPPVDTYASTSDTEVKELTVDALPTDFAATPPDSYAAHEGNWGPIDTLTPSLTDPAVSEPGQAPPAQLARGQRIEFVRTPAIETAPAEKVTRPFAHRQMLATETVRLIAESDDEVISVTENVHDGTTIERPKRGGTSESIDQSDPSVSNSAHRRRVQGPPIAADIASPPAAEFDISTVPVVAKDKAITSPRKDHHAWRAGSEQRINALMPKSTDVIAVLSAPRQVASDALVDTVGMNDSYAGPLGNVQPVASVLHQSTDPSASIPAQTSPDQTAHSRAHQTSPFPSVGSTAVEQVMLSNAQNQILVSEFVRPIPEPSGTVTFSDIKMSALSPNARQKPHTTAGLIERSASVAQSSTNGATVSERPAWAPSSNTLSIQEFEPALNRPTSDVAVPPAVGSVQVDVTPNQARFAADPTDVVPNQSEFAAARADVVSDQFKVAAFQTDVAPPEADVVSAQAEFAAQARVAAFQANTVPTAADVEVTQSNAVPSEALPVADRASAVATQARAVPFQANVVPTLAEVGGDVVIRADVVPAEADLLVARADISPAQVIAAPYRANVVSIPGEFAEVGVTQADVALAESELLVARADSIPAQAKTTSLQTNVVPVSGEAVEVGVTQAGAALAESEFLVARADTIPVQAERAAARANVVPNPIDVVAELLADITPEAADVLPVPRVDTADASKGRGDLSTAQQFGRRQRESKSILPPSVVADMREVEIPSAPGNLTSGPPIPVDATTFEISTPAHRNNDAPRSLEATRSLPHQLADHIISARREVSHGSTRIEISLNPPELGRVSIEISNSQDQLSARILVAEPATLQSVTADLPTLLDSLADAGVTIDKFQFGHFQDAETSSGETDDKKSPAELLSSPPDDTDRVGTISAAEHFGVDVVA